MTRIAFVGKLGSGKSTAANILSGSGWHRHSWANGVRDIFSMAFDPITPLNYADVKTRVYTVWEKGLLVERTGRELLQRIGTDALRNNVSEDFWLRVGIRNIPAEGHVVNDDTRFLNEAAALRDLGFVIVRITRPGTTEGTHPSELEQDSIVADHTIANDGNLSDLAYSVRQYAFDLLPINSPAGVGVSPTDVGPGHEIVSEEWGAGDGRIYDLRDGRFVFHSTPRTRPESLLGDRYVEAGVEYRGEWPPDTRVAGLLTCCGQTQHPIDCPQWR